MSLAALQTAVLDYLNVDLEVYPSETTTRWVRQAEEAISERLQCPEMVRVVEAEVRGGRSELPADWIMADFVRVVDGFPLRYRTRDAWYDNRRNVPNYNQRHYSISGNFILTASDDETPVTLELTYYAKVPEMGTNPTWLWERYQKVYIFATLEAGALYSFEDERKPLWESTWKDEVAAITARHLRSKTSGGFMAFPRRTSFG